MSGNLFLDNSVVNELTEEVKSNETTFNDALYSQYQTSFKVANSNYFKGGGADAFKNYVTTGAINIISGLMDVVSEIAMIASNVAEKFNNYETDPAGRVEQPILDQISQELDTEEVNFDNAKSGLNTNVQEASNYISTKDLALDNVNTSHTETRETLTNISTDLSDCDTQALTDVNLLYQRITSLYNFVDQTMTFCYNADGTINVDNIEKLTQQNWYKPQTNLALALKLQEDPFTYVAGETSLTEAQWAAGLFTDVYIYAGYTEGKAFGEYGTENGASYAEGEFVVVGANLYGQFTDYASAQINLKMLYGDGDVKIGMGDDYFGAHLKGGIGFAQADASVVLGSEEFNVHAEADAKLLCADGKVAFEFEDDGEFAIGFDGSADAASASAGIGFSFLDYEIENRETKETKSLFAGNLDVDVGIKASAGLWLESETAIETDFVNVNATTVKVNLALLVGLKIDITIPTLYFKWPW